MKIGVNFKIDVTKLDKTKFFKAKSGAVYADLTVFIDPDTEDKYGSNGSITQALTKEERQQKAKAPFIGNAKVFWREKQEHAPNKNDAEMLGGDAPKDDIPF